MVLYNAGGFVYTKMSVAVTLRNNLFTRCYLRDWLARSLVYQLVFVVAVTLTLGLILVFSVQMHAVGNCFALGTAMLESPE